MSDETIKTVTDIDDSQLNTEIDELNRKEDRNDEDVEKLSTLKKERGTRYQKRLDTLTYQKKTAEETAETERKKYDTLLAENERLRSQKVEPVTSISNETIAVDGKSFYTDTTLENMVEAKKMTTNEAYKHQQDRVKAEAVELAVERIKGEEKERQTKSKIQQDAREILNKYPQWDEKHPKYNANDTMMREVIDLHNSGLSLKKSLEIAEKVYGVKNTNIDNTENLSLHSPSAPTNESREKVTLSEDEQERAWRTWRDKDNPKTGRKYTRSETIEKAKNALLKRSR